MPSRKCFPCQCRRFGHVRAQELVAVFLSYEHLPESQFEPRSPLTTICLAAPRCYIAAAIPDSVRSGGRTKGDIYPEHVLRASEGQP